MLLFLMGIGLAELALLSILLFGCGIFISWLASKIFRKALKDATEKKIKLLSRTSAFIFSPVLVIGSLALFIYIEIQNTPQESDEEIVRNHYEIMEKNIREDFKPGMSKNEVVGLLGETDTTQSTLIYDLSLPDANEKYILEITFDQYGLKDFKRR